MPASEDEMLKIITSLIRILIDTPLEFWYK